ncbi:MAG: DNA polymerase III subunit beta [Flavobacteriales bacterium]|nr:DNA polymerase III subunit beta [Flavobacteriales bacterium]
MKFIVSSTSLLKQLQAINGVLSSNNTLPILDNFLFEIGKNYLIISASDLETTISAKITIEAKEDGNIAIPARLLLDTLKTFPEQPLTFDVNLKTNSIEISSDFGKYKLAGHNADEFPKLPTIESPASIVLKPEVLVDALTSTLFATGNDELRPVMSGVLCEISPDDVTFVATDAHKLVKYRRTDSSADELTSFILPKKPLNLLKSILGNIEGDVKIEYNKSNALFSFGHVNLICRLIDGNYPNYSAVIPDKNPNKLVIDRATLLGSIKRVSIFSNKTTHQVKLNIKGSELSISAEDLDYSNEANERLTCEYKGEDLKIGFNARFLIEMLSNMDSEAIVIELSTPNKAGIILPHNEDKDNKGKEVLMLIMPVMLNT